MVTETYKLINAVSKMYPVPQFFKNRYFPDGKVFYSEKALIETKKGNKKVAPFVVPVVGGIVMEADGYSAEEVKAPFIAPKMRITAQELEKKAFGESPESGRTPAQRENEIESEHMDDMRRSIFRRQELMCAEIIANGEVQIRQYATANDAAGDLHPEIEYLRFYRSEFKNRYKFTKAWTDMTASEKIQEFYKAASILKRRGVRATDIVMTGDVSMGLMTDKDFLDYYDKLHVNTGTIDQGELPDGVTANGSINVNGIIFTLFTYDETYVDLDGEEKEILPKGTIAFLRPGMGTTVYSQVTFVKGGSFQSHAERIVPRTVVSEDENIMEVQMFSRPVPYPLDWDGWLVANIYDDVAKSQDEADNAVDTHEPATEGVDLKGEDEIRAMTAKADVIAYAESIGLSGLSRDMKLEELKAKTIRYQNDTYSD
jgi:hypothetical protein